MFIPACGSGDGDADVAAAAEQAEADRAATERANAEADAARAETERIEAEAAAADAERLAAEAQPQEELTVADEAVAAPAAAAVTGDVVDFAMPDFVGQTLQVAQDTVQGNGVWFSVSHDMLADRSQVLDANWQVCEQSPAPGTRVQGAAADWEGAIDFGAVKLSERCP